MPRDLLASPKQPRDLLAGQGAPQPAQPKTLQERAKETFGFEDYAYRGSVLPLGRTKEGELELATPGVLKDMMTSFLLPGHVAKGGSYEPKDVTRMALDFAAPMTAGRGVGAGRAPTVGRRQFTEAAPSTEQLKGQARAFKSAATESGVRVNPDRFADLVAGIETNVRMNKLNPTLHPKSSAAFDILSKSVGDDLDVEDLMIVRRLIGVAQRSTDPDLADDRRIAGMMEDALDDFVDNLGEADVLAGDPSKVASNLAQFRSLWSRAKKSEMIEGIIEKAGTQASGFENGIRIGFRELLRNPKKIRGFTEDEVKLMKQIASGGGGRATMMRLLGKLSYGTRGGSNFVGGSIGTAGGAALMGPLGAMAAPIIGHAAQGASNAAALRQAELARALAATGGKMPQGRVNPSMLAETLMKAGLPVAGTQLPQKSPFPRYDPRNPNVL